MSEYSPHSASFKDPAGFIFYSNGNYYRQVNQICSSDYELLMSSGLYKTLVEKKLLIPHTEISENLTQSPDWHKTILPAQLSFISYPYEWCFDELKDAALLTLSVVKNAMEFGMILKDAANFNVQFQAGRPVFIDTLSFTKYDAEKPWIAYKQFCECFLFPLLIEYYLKIDVQKLLSSYINGIPVTVAARLLPFKSRIKLSVWFHVYLQNAVGSGNKLKTRDLKFSREKLSGLIDNLESAIESLHVKDNTKSTWNSYYDEKILGRNYLLEKEKIFRQWISNMDGGLVLDIGCNEGYFSRIVAEKKLSVIAIDSDSLCINKLYEGVKNNPQNTITPLCIDISNPTPAIGFRQRERQSFEDRVKADTVIALAIFHHLVLTENIPMNALAEMLAFLTRDCLIIEFVPLDDEKAQQLIANKECYHLPYDKNAFEKAFEPFFSIEKEQIIPGTGRILYCMKKV